MTVALIANIKSEYTLIYKIIALNRINKPQQIQTLFVSVITLLTYNSNCFTTLQMDVFINKGRNNIVAFLFHAKSIINIFFALIA